MKFRMPDGQEYTGRSYDDVVQHMSDDKLTEPRNLESYRRATAKRYSEAFHVVVDSDTSRGFIDSLCAAELMERVS